MALNPSRIFIVGASGHGSAAEDAAVCQGFEVVGFLDSFKPVGHFVGDSSVIGHPDDLSSLARDQDVSGYFLAISDNRVRQEVAAKLRAASPELEWVRVIHPRSVVAKSAGIGAGALIMAGAIVNPGCIIHEGAIVNTNASLDHDGELKAFASLLPGVTTGGNVVVGECSCICLGSKLAHQVAVGEHTFVGAGSVVLKDLPSFVLAYGSPARVIRSRSAGERHF